MKLRLEKANAFEIDPNKKYVVMITYEPQLWTAEQKEGVEATLQRHNMDVVFMPKGTKYKVVESDKK